MESNGDMMAKEINCWLLTRRTRISLLAAID